MLGLHAVVETVHTIEEAFRGSAGGWPRETVDSFFEAAAALRRVAERVGTKEQDRALERLSGIRLRPPRGAEAGPGPDRGAPIVPVAEQVGAEVEAESSTGVEAAESAGAERAPEGEAASPAAGAGQSASEPAADVEEEQVDAAEAGGAAEVLRVPFAKLDALLNRVGELVSVESALEELLDRFAAELEAAGARRALEAQVESLGLITDALRDATMDLRLVPVGRVFQRFPSLARDLARRQGKQVRVILEGEEVELDKSTVDALSDPLLHLVRNAVDHGIGTPETRSAAGKPATGTITLRATRSGDRVLVEVCDDGSGLDREAILARARSEGLVGEHERLTGPEIDELVFRAGFSTRSEATTVSGRGVGLEVVRRRVAALRGELAVGAAPGGGTRFTLALPLTLAIVPALLFESGGETLALPAAEVQETLRRVRPERAGGAEVVRHRDDLIPVARTPRLLGWSSGSAGMKSAPEAATAPFAIVLRRGSRTAAVLADRLLEQRDVVVRALPRALGTVRGVSGATVTPGGRVVLLLDSSGLLDMNLDLHRREARAG